jgi:hypothetical protein
MGERLRAAAWRVHRVWFWSRVIIRNVRVSVQVHGKLVIARDEAGSPVGDDDDHSPPLEDWTCVGRAHSGRRQLPSKEPGQVPDRESADDQPVDQEL